MSRDRVHVVENGVDIAYFDPAIEFSNPFCSESVAIVFTGQMDYFANADAVHWFAHEVLPAIQKRIPECEFWIVGAEPGHDVLKLGQLKGVHVTGRVADTRPYLRHAAVVVAPLRIARGVQNKILEAMAMGCQVVCSGEAATGLKTGVERSINVAAGAEDMIQASLRCIENHAVSERNSGARGYVSDNYQWRVNLDGLSDVGLTEVRDHSDSAQHSSCKSPRRAAQSCNGSTA